MTDTRLYFVRMVKRDPKWSARSGTRPAQDRDGGADGPETWVNVSDGHGGHWTVTVEGERLTSLTVHAHDVRQIDLRAVPLVELRTVALAHVREVEALRDDGYQLADALQEIGTQPPELMPDGRTPVADFISAYRAAGPRARPDGQIDRSPRRQQLAEQFSVSVYTVDKWVRSLRNRGELEESAIARNRTTDADRAGSQNEERNR